MPPIQRILFPTDFSLCAEGAFRHAAVLADRFGAELHVVHAVEDEAAPERAWPAAPGTGRLQVTWDDVYDDLRLPPAPPAAPPDEVEVVEVEVVGDSPVAALLDYARDEEADLIVMGTHGRRGWERDLIGSVAEAVTRRAPCPVLTVRPLATDGARRDAPGRVLLALDVVPDGATVPPAARWAARLALAYGLPLTLLHAASPVLSGFGGAPEARRTRSAAHERLLQIADQLRAESGEALEVEAVVRTGATVETLLAVAEEAPTHLLVVGTHGRRGAGRLLMGSVAEDVMRSAPCPVLVVRDALPASDGAA